MQSWPAESSESRPPQEKPQEPPRPFQDGFHHQESRGSAQPPCLGSGRDSPHSVADARRDSAASVLASRLDSELQKLSVQSSTSEGRRPVAGQRIIDYENAAITPSIPKHAPGFKVVKRVDWQNDGIQLSDFPNGKDRRTTSNWTRIALLKCIQQKY